MRFIVCMSTSLLTPILILVESIQETKWHKLELVILHEIAHALQYYSYKINNFSVNLTDLPGEIFTVGFVIDTLNPYLDNQPALRKEYEGMVKKVGNGFPFQSSYSRAAGGK